MREVTQHRNKNKCWHELIFKYSTVLTLTLLLIQHSHLGNSFHTLTKRDSIQSMYWIRPRMKTNNNILLVIPHQMDEWLLHQFDEAVTFNWPFKFALQPLSHIHEYQWRRNKIIGRSCEWLSHSFHMVSLDHDTKRIQRTKIWQNIAT